jgi:hypothetical protein
LIAHWLTPLTDYPADGFSRPYQLAISLESLLIACLGLWLLRLVLQRHFPDLTVAIVLVTITFATNYLDYAGINSAMSHNYLFTAYALLIWLSDNYWKKPSSTTAFFIGLVVGIMALTRPTEVVAILIPLLWGVSGEKSMRKRVRTLQNKWPQILIVGTAALLIGSIQLVYWKYVSDNWIVYSYEDQGFSWLSPHLIDGMFSYRSGWLVYTPIMLVSLIGFGFLYRRAPHLFHACIVVSGIFMYITWAWDIWWYGGSLGQRAMVQLYPVLAFPLAASVDWVLLSKPRKYVGLSVLVVCIYYNLWLTHQAHRGGLLEVGQMNKAYFWHILGRYKVPPETRFLLDNAEVYRGVADGDVAYNSDFEDLVHAYSCDLVPVSGNSAVCVGPEHLSSGLIPFTIPPKTHWLRASATFRGGQREWDPWKMSQFTLHLMRDGHILKSRAIRIHRVLEDGATQTYASDISIPDDLEYEVGAVELIHFGSAHNLLMDDLQVIAY